MTEEALFGFAVLALSNLAAIIVGALIGAWLARGRKKDFADDWVALSDEIESLEDRLEDCHNKTESVENQLSGLYRRLAILRESCEHPRIAPKPGKAALSHCPDCGVSLYRLREKR